MDADSLTAFVRFHAFANRRIIETAAELSDEELEDPVPSTTGRPSRPCATSWRSTGAGASTAANDVGPTYVWERVALEDLASIQGFSGVEDARLLAVVCSLNDASLAEPLSLGDRVSLPRWLIVAHVVNHGTQYRSELARFFTDRGHPPGELDLLDAYAL
jgi:uncharacterized damage-inducible protein DinB